jgi:hypothetical protein
MPQRFRVSGRRALPGGGLDSVSGPAQAGAFALAAAIARHVPARRIAAGFSKSLISNMFFPSVTDAQTASRRPNPG